MISTLHVIGTVVLVFTCGSALAQSTEAARYVNHQGVEVIEARRPLPAIVDPVQAEKPSGARTGGGAEPVSAVEAKLQVSAQEQRGRDEDRMTILKRELAVESAAFETKVKVMQNAALKAKLSEEELKRLQETIVDHEKNIRALNGEIGRLRLQH